MENAFKMLEVTMEMSLSPLHLQRLRHGIENTLNALLMRFQPLLNGVLISYRGVELCGGATGGFATETAQITFTIRFEALVFQVQRGDAIVGTVNKVGADHIGLLVFGIFNAAIAVDQMPPSSRYDASGGGASAAAAAAAEADAVPSSSPTPTREALWRLPAGTLGEGSSDVLRLGSRVSFVVVGMHSEDGVVSIAGALRDASSRSRSASMASLGGAESGEDSNALTRSSSGGGGGGGGGDQQRPAKRRRSASGDDASSDAKRARSSSAGSSGSVPSLASATATAAAAATATVTAAAAAADSDSDSRSSSNDAKPPPAAAAAAAAAAASDKQPAAAAQPQPAPPPAQMTAAEKTQKKQSKKAKRRASQKARRAKGL